MAREAHAPARIEFDPFRFEPKALLEAVAIGPSDADGAPRIDYPVPRNRGGRWKGVQGVSRLTSLPREPRQSRDLPVGGDPSAGHPSHDCIDALIRAHLTHHVKRPSPRASDETRMM
jgi:hypothetical protein